MLQNILEIFNLDNLYIKYNKYLIDKYVGKEIKLKFKFYTNTLRSTYTKIDARISSYSITNSRRVIFSMGRPNCPSEILVRINPICNKITICDELGNSFNPNKRNTKIFAGYVQGIRYSTHNAHGQEYYQEPKIETTDILDNINNFFMGITHSIRDKEDKVIEYKFDTIQKDSLIIEEVK